MKISKRTLSRLYYGSMGVIAWSMCVGAVYVGTYTFAFMSLTGLVVHIYSVGKLMEKE